MPLTMDSRLKEISHKFMPKIATLQQEVAKARHGQKTPYKLEDMLDEIENLTDERDRLIQQEMSRSFIAVDEKMRKMYGENHEENRD